MGQRTDDLLFAIYEQLVELNGKVGTLSAPQTREDGPGSTTVSDRYPGKGHPSISLPEAISKYLDLKRHEVSDQHLANTESALRKMVPKPIAWNVDQVTRGDIESRRDALLEEGRSVKTVNNHLTTFSAFFKYAIASGWTDEDPAAGLKLKEKGRSSRKRKAFTPEQIKHVFEGLPTGMNPGSGMRPMLARAGWTVAEDFISAKAWVPLIMLYTGARPEEVAQLRVDDVRRVPGDRTLACTAEPISPQTPIPPLWGGPVRWVFDFQGEGEGQRIKNEASRRLVPVHPRLWELGLRILINEERVPWNKQLFPELNAGANGRLAEAPSRWFNENWLRKVKGITDPKLVLYSIRHSVATQLKHAGVEESMIAQILGHTNSSMTTGRYGKEFPLENMQAALELLPW